MNELNYASLEASKKLVENGIVLKTDFYWRVWSGLTIRHMADNGAEIVSKKEKESLQDPTSETSDNKRYDVRYYPAPCFTDVWRELPLKESPSGYAHLVFYSTGISWVTNTDESFFAFGSKFNPTDTLIDLLVWLKGEMK